MDQVSQVREKIDLVVFISEFLPLKKLGRNFKTNCPFHNEKTPSFVISPERQIWHCFGCNKGGDVFTFLMEYEHIEFGEALRLLAKRAGVVLEQSKFASETSSKKEKIYAINHLACEFYHYILMQHAVGKKALTYLQENRKINEKVIKTFMLGYAPRSGNILVNYLIKKKHYTKEDVLEAGLGTQRYAGIGDFFANRLMFPLYDHRNNVIGFSGRVLEDTPNDDGPKYVNTRETLVYHKGDVFFGLQSTKDEIRKQNTAIIMEGEFDVISSYQEGIGNVVAVKGTALTENQVTLLGRFAEKVSLCFDRDRAGKEALKRSFLLLEKKGLTTTVIVPPSGKDPDEAVKTDPIAFKQAVKHAVSVYDFLLDDAFASYDKKTIEGKKQISDALLPFYAVIENEIIKEHYLKKLANELDTSYESIVKQAGKLQRREVEDTLKVTAKEKKPRGEMLETYLLSLVLQHVDPKKGFLQVQKYLSEFSFTIPAYQKILQNLSVYFSQFDTFDQGKFLTLLPPELQEAFDRCFLFPLPLLEEAKFDAEIAKVAKDMQVLFIRNKIKLLADTVKTMEQGSGEGENQETEQVKALQEELSRLTVLLRSLQ